MNLPEDFTAYTREWMGEDLFADFMKGMKATAPTSIRLNPFKCPSCTHITDEDDTEVVPWCPTTGRYLSERRNFTFDPLLHAGLYYVQEASSMFIDLAIREYVKQPVRMLDLCAAPGGKSTAIRAALPEGSLLFSNEPMRTRSQILAENIQKFGHPDVIVTNNFPRDYKKSKLQFDVILTDVPCSGEGMFRKDEGAIKEWSTSNVNNCWQLQREIVSDIWNCLKPGGILIYSTCTFNGHEDEENVLWIEENLGAERLPMPIEERWNITGSLLKKDESTDDGQSNKSLATDDYDNMYHFIPGKSKGEGLFLAVLRKNGCSEEMDSNSKGKKDKKKKNNKDTNKGNNRVSIPENWLNDTAEWSYQNTESGIYGIHSTWKPMLDEATKSLKVIHAGVKLGSIKGKDLIPDQSLALCTELHKDTFPKAELSYEDAIQYLRKEAITLPDSLPRGYVLVTYRGIPLGWMKNLGNRANNLYPQEWKIKSSHIPGGNNNLITW